MTETPRRPKPGAPRPAASRLCLVVMGDGISATHPLPDSGRVSIGRSRSCDVFIDDESISRKHAILELGETWSIEDAGSANGTRVGDTWLPPGHPVPVRAGEVIDIGSVMILVQDRSGPQRKHRLWNHGHFEARIEDECARSARSGAGFAVLQLHVEARVPVGAALETLDEVLRAADVVGQYGPGEYEALLVDVAPGEVELVTTRIAARFETKGARVRLGVATYPTDGRDPYALVAAAVARARGEPAHEQAHRVVIAEGAMQQLHRLVARIASGNLSLLILGETGAGKEVLAESVHRTSPRAPRPFVRLDCAALAESRLESELFGHERGAFPGAIASKPGLLETADGGTLFLDEVGELPLATQEKLLRVLEAREVLRVGGLRPCPIDVRIVSATNRDLEAEIARGTFRQDLYFRMNGMTLVIPPLRQRVGEIAGLARAFVAQVAGAGRAPAISGEAMRLLERYTWPGNLRELRNVIERAVLLCDDGEIRSEHLPLEKMRADPVGPRAELVPKRPDTAPHVVPAPAPAPARPAMRHELDALERTRILEALEACGGNQTRAAQVVGISRRTLLKRLDEYRIIRPRKPKAR